MLNINIDAKGLDLIPIKNKLENERFKMFKLINWRTSLIGFLILVVKFLETQNIIALGTGNFIITTLTGLLGFISADSKNVS